MQPVLFDAGVWPTVGDRKRELTVAGRAVYLSWRMKILVRSVTAMLCHWRLLNDSGYRLFRAISPVD